MENNTLEQAQKNSFALLRGDTENTPIGAILPSSIQEAIILSKTLFASRLFPDLQNAEQALVKIMAGSEMGMPPFASLNGFHIVKGKVMAHYTVIGMRVKQVGCNYKLTVDKDDVQTLMFYGRKGEELGESTFTLADAKRVGTQNIDKMPRTMLFARAMSNGTRRFVPEAFNGNIVYSFEEREEIEREETPEFEVVGSSERVRSNVVDYAATDEFDPFHPTDDQPALTGDEDV